MVEDFLQKNPKAAYMGYLPGFDSPAMQQYYMNAFPEIYSMYMGALGKEATTMNKWLAAQPGKGPTKELTPFGTLKDITPSATGMYKPLKFQDFLGQQFGLGSTLADYYKGKPEQWMPGARQKSFSPPARWLMY